MDDIALDRRAPKIRAPVWHSKAPFSRAPHWLGVLAHLKAKHSRNWQEPDKYATEMPFLEDDWPHAKSQAS